MSARTTIFERPSTVAQTTCEAPQPHAWIAELGGQVAIIASICVSILAPPIRFSDNFPFLKAEQILLPLIVLFYLWFLLAGYVRPVRFNGMFVVGLIYSLCFAASTWYGASLLEHPVMLRDFYEIPKVLFPVLFFTLAYEAGWRAAEFDARRDSNPYLNPDRTVTRFADWYDWNAGFDERERVESLSADIKDGRYPVIRPRRGHATRAPLDYAD